MLLEVLLITQIQIDWLHSAIKCAGLHPPDDLLTAVLSLGDLHDQNTH